MTAGTRLVGAALAVVLTAGCGGGSGAGADRPEREWDVAADPDATPAEVVAAGGPVDVALSPDGRQRLVTWQAEGGGGDGPTQGAWRLSDADGTTVAEGGPGPVTEQGGDIGVVAVDDGFVLESYTAPALLRVATDGTTSPVRVAREPRATRPGDVLVRVVDRPDLVAYRPSDRTAAPLPPLPTRSPQGVALAPGGAVWVLLPGRTADGVAVARSADGQAPWSRTAVPLPRDAFPVTDTLVATGGDVVLLSARESPGSLEGVVDTLWSRADDSRSRWRPTALDIGDVGEVAGARVQRVGDRRLVTTWSDGAWVQAADASGWDEVPRPSADARLLARGDRLWALGYRSNMVWVSDDGGGAWQEVRR